AETGDWTVQRRGTPLATAFYTEDGKRHLPNYPKESGFSFIKVNGEGNPLGGVVFEIYGGLNGKTLDIGVNDNPLAPDTYWDMSTPVQTQPSHSTTGEVNFSGLKSGDYLLVETKTVDGYELPAGQWIITVDTNAGTVTDPLGRGDILPPAFYKDSGNLYLPNYKKQVMPMAGGMGLHVIASLGVLLIGLSILLLLGKKHI
ncbi:prealbumin-like fold domain-containing protein, partial [Enterococcus sp. 3H8_DIV0648]|uniref:prealbumin-like fold domain-containing protein n=2 Tax=Enterococcus TaxID=1350 RepID=UPI000B63B213